MADPKKEPGLAFHQIFLVRAGFGHAPNFLEISSANVDDLDLEIQFEVSELESTGSKEKVAAVSARVRTAKTSKHPYSIDCEMMAVVGEVAGEENIPPLDYVKGAAATLLYPFMRELVANLTSRGRFGPIWLQPFNVQRAMSDTNLVTAKD